MEPVRGTKGWSSAGPSDLHHRVETDSDGFSSQLSGFQNWEEQILHCQSCLVWVSEQPKPIETFAQCEDAENQVNMFIMVIGLETIDHVCHSCIFFIT